MGIQIYLTFAFGGILGSLLTLIIKAFIEERQRISENRRLLKKIYFENKLKAAEAAISIWHSLRTNLINLSASYNAASRIDKEVNFEVFQTVVERANSTLIKLNESLNSGGNSILLYYDTDKIKNWTSSDSEIMIELLSDSAELNENLLYYLEESKKAIGPQKEHIDNLIDDAIKRLKDNFKNISGLYTISETFYRESISSIRNDIELEIK